MLFLCSTKGAETYTIAPHSILQYMENGPIRNVLKDRNGVAGTAGMSLEIQWALQVAEGLNFLHTIPPPSGP